MIEITEHRLEIIGAHLNPNDGFAIGNAAGHKIGTMGTETNTSRQTVSRRYKKSQFPVQEFTIKELEHLWIGFKEAQREQQEARQHTNQLRELGLTQKAALTETTRQLLEDAKNSSKRVKPLVESKVTVNGFTN